MTAKANTPTTAATPTIAQPVIDHLNVSFFIILANESVFSSLLRAAAWTNATPAACVSTGVESVEVTSTTGGVIAGNQVKSAALTVVAAVGVSVSGAGVSTAGAQLKSAALTTVAVVAGASVALVGASVAGAEVCTGAVVGSATSTDASLSLLNPSSIELSTEPLSSQVESVLSSALSAGNLDGAEVSLPSEGASVESEDAVEVAAELAFDWGLLVATDPLAGADVSSAGASVESDGADEVVEEVADGGLLAVEPESAGASVGADVSSVGASVLSEGAEDAADDVVEAALD